MHGDITREEAIAEMGRLNDLLVETRQAGQELATALWALVLAQQPSMADGLSAALAHAEEIAKKYTSEEDRTRLSFALMRAKAGLGAEGMRA